MLTSENVYLRLLEKEDLYRLVEWRNKSYEDFYEYPFSNYNQQAWFEKHSKCGDLLFIICKCNNKEIGIIGLSEIDNRNRNAKFGRFFVGRKFRGNGYGKDAIIMILNYAFKHLNLHSVYLDTFKSNIRVINFYEKIGFKQEGIKQDHVYKNGKYNDLTCMRILKRDWIE